MRWSVLLLLLWVTPALAELVVCGDATPAYPVPAFTGHLSVDPTKAPATLQGKPCYVVSKASGETASQLAVIASQPPYFLKVVNERVVVLTQGEQDAWTAAQQAALDARQALRDEATQQDICSTATLSQINTLLATRRATLQTAIDTAKANQQADIDALAAANLASLQAALTH